MRLADTRPRKTYFSGWFLRNPLAGAIQQMRYRPSGWIAAAIGFRRSAIGGRRSAIGGRLSATAAVGCRRSAVGYRLSAGARRLHRRWATRAPWRRPNLRGRRQYHQYRWAAPMPPRRLRRSTTARSLRSSTLRARRTRGCRRRGSPKRWGEAARIGSDRPGGHRRRDGSALRRGAAHRGPGPRHRLPTRPGQRVGTRRQPGAAGPSRGRAGHGRRLGRGTGRGAARRPVRHRHRRSGPAAAVRLLSRPEPPHHLAAHRARAAARGRVAQPAPDRPARDGGPEPRGRFARCGRAAGGRLGDGRRCGAARTSAGRGRRSPGGPRSLGTRTPAGGGEAASSRPPAPVALYLHRLTLAGIARLTHEHESTVSRKARPVAPGHPRGVEEALRTGHRFADADLQQCYDEAVRHGSIDLAELLKAEDT